MIKQITLFILAGTSICGTPAKPIGLKNCGNSCFFNAALQSIVSMDKFTSVLKAQAYTPGSISHAFTEFLHSLGQTQASVLHVDSLALQSWKLLDAARYTQQDAEDFLLALFNQLLDSGKRTESSKLIRTQLFTHIGAKKKNEPSLILSLPIADGDSCFTQCLDHFFDGEMVSLGGQTVRKHYTLKKTPHYLIFGLKRNYYVQKTHSLAKRTERISFPLERLSLRRYEEKPTDKQYALIAIIMHVGSANGGHYTAYVKRDSSVVLL